MKSVRQVAILDIIEKQDVETQEELADALRAQGIKVTQATVSRDIKELRLLKVLTPSGAYKYATADKAENGLSDRFIRVLAESMLSVAGATWWWSKPCPARPMWRLKRWTACTGRRSWAALPGTTPSCW